MHPYLRRTSDPAGHNTLYRREDQWRARGNSAITGCFARCLLVVTPPAWPASVRGPFFPLWLPQPCSQKRRASVLLAQTGRHNKSPTAMALGDRLASSRRTNSRLGQILHACTIDGDGRLNFQTAVIRTWLCVNPSLWNLPHRPSQQRFGNACGGKLAPCSNDKDPIWLSRSN
jgi:hypothetical protein